MLYQRYGLILGSKISEETQGNDQNAYVGHECREGLEACDSDICCLVLVILPCSSNKFIILYFRHQQKPHKGFVAPKGQVQNLKTLYSKLNSRFDYCLPSFICFYYICWPINMYQLIWYWLQGISKSSDEFNMKLSYFKEKRPAHSWLSTTSL